eukprot:scaffold14319_cov148-Skeletonema_menzelii.AAC.11
MMKIATIAALIGSASAFAPAQTTGKMICDELERRIPSGCALPWRQSRLRSSIFHCNSRGGGRVGRSASLHEGGARGIWIGDYVTGLTNQPAVDVCLENFKERPSTLGANLLTRANDN